jgi:DUF1680 family protein
MADVATEFSDDSLTETLKGLWEDLTSKQMYVTGGIGPAASNEGFTEYYDLPNESAYAETCAAVALMMWASRMLGRGPDRQYADVMEQALYNGALAGLSINGTRFFYDNPLESRGGHHRWTWHRCPCCPPNIARTVAAIGSYMYGVSADGVAVHLYGESTARLKLSSVLVTLTQHTTYPADGRVKIGVGLEKAATFALALRVPGWCDTPSLTLNGEVVELGEMDGGYIRLNRAWQDGDVLILDLPMNVRALHAHPAVKADLGRVAVARGPLIYCAEEADNSAELNALILPPNLEAARTSPVPELGGALAILLPARREEWRHRDGKLYDTRPPDLADVTARLIPYHLWDNRAPGEMLVWIRSSR